MRKFKTAEKNRTDYIYYTAEGKKVEVKPEQDGIDETWIALLHGMDDEQVDADRREEYHAPVHLDSYHNGNDEDASDYNAYLESDSLSPLEEICQAIDEQSRADKHKKLQEALKTLQPQQLALVKKVFYEKRTNVDIASEEGVTEVAIRNRLKKIYTNLQKKIEKM